MATHRKDCVKAEVGDEVICTVDNYSDAQRINMQGRSFKVLELKSWDGYFRQVLEGCGDYAWWLNDHEFELKEREKLKPLTKLEIKSAKSFPDHSELAKFLNI